MKYRMKIQFCILFVLKTFSPSLALHSSPEYDLTDALQNSISGIFQAVVTATTFSFFKPQQPPSTATNLKIKDKTFLYHTWVGENYSLARLNVDFVHNEMYIVVEKYCIPSLGKLTNKDDTEEVYTIYSEIEVKNVIIKTDELFRINDSREKYTIAVSFHDTTNSKALSQVCQISPDNPVKNSHHQHLAQLCKPAFLTLIRNKLIEHGKRLTAILRLKTCKVLFSNRLNFAHDKLQDYYYSISTFPYFCFNLTNITIQGLTNYQELRKTDEPFIYTLWIKNIRGSMILDYGSKVETPMPLNFAAEHISISVDLKNSRVNVVAQNYRIARTEDNALLTELHSEIIMQHVESAIATSLMPSMKIGRTGNRSSQVYDMESPTGKMLNNIIQNSDRKTLKHMLREWVPFNDHYISTQTEPYNYHISFPNITINLISEIPYPEQIQCQFPNNLVMTHEMKVTPIRKLRLSNKEGNGVDINFHANFTSISFSQISPNTSTDDEGCEFQLYNNEDIRIAVSPLKNTSQDKDELKLKKKIDATLISMTKERITRSIKPMVCVPFEICSQVAQTIDHFFQRFVDNVLEKCWLQRNTK